MYKKLEFSFDIIDEFTTREWKFDNINTRELWSSLSREDRKTFYHSFEGFDWHSYMSIYFHGIRKHILKEDLSNKKAALAKYRMYGFTKIMISILIEFKF